MRKFDKYDVVAQEWAAAGLCGRLGISVRALAAKLRKGNFETVYGRLMARLCKYEDHDPRKNVAKPVPLPRNYAYHRDREINLTN